MILNMYTAKVSHFKEKIFVIVNGLLTILEM